MCPPPLATIGDGGGVRERERRTAKGDAALSWVAQRGVRRRPASMRAVAAGGAGHRREMIFRECGFDGRSCRRSHSAGYLARFRCNREALGSEACGGQIAGEGPHLE